jgi:hypothetical protein
MKDCRAHAQLLLKIGKNATVPDLKAQAVAAAQMWLTLAVLEEAIAHLKGQGENETVVH